jgi:hypothetical protein
MTKVTASLSENGAGVPQTSLALFKQNSSSDDVPGALNDDLLVREVITNSIKRSGKSREQIADEMSRGLAIAVTARMISSFTAESKELHRWPGAWDRAFCAAVADDALLKCRVELAGYQVIDTAEAQLLALGREYLRQKRASAQVEILERQLQGLDL